MNIENNEITTSKFQTQFSNKNKGKERKGKERKGKERKGKERKGKAITKILKLQSVSFTSLFENLVLQPGAELSLLRELYSGTASAWMNLMFWGECVAVSHHPGVKQTLSNHRF